MIPVFPLLALFLSRSTRTRPRLGTTTGAQQPQALGAGFQRDDSESVHRLYEFLQEQDCEGFESLAIGWTTTEQPNDGLRGLFAMEAFEPGEFLLAIPFSATLMVQEKMIQQDANDSETEQDRSSEGLHDDSEMEQAVAFLELFCSDSMWKAYVDCLPSVQNSSFVATPDFWPTAVLEQFPVPRLRQQSLERQRRIRAAASKSMRTQQDLQWALWIMRSRGFTSLKQINGKLRERTILLPLIDMINHDGDNPNTSIEVIETDKYNESFVALQATRPISKTEPITLRYGTGFETSLELLDRYGFYTESNPNDYRIDWDLVEADRLPHDTKTIDSSDASLSQLNRFCRYLSRLRQTS